MDIDALTIGTTDYEDLIISDSADNMSSEAGGLAGPLGPLAGLAGGDGAGAQLATYNYTSLESIVTEVWERRPALPGVQLHEACVLLLSALVVGVHGLAGLLQSALSPLSPRAVWALLNAGLALGCLYALAQLCLAAHAALCRRFLHDDEEDVDEKAAPEAGSQEEEQPLESFVSAQLEKEERVQRWIDNLCASRDQVNLEACGEMEGRNMEAEVSSADLLGDGQPSRPAPTTAPVAPRVPRPLASPPPPPPPALQAAEVAAMSREGRRALSLAYELSLAVRQQTTSNIRATLSAPEGSIQGSSQGALSTLAEHKDAWKVVRRGKEALEVPHTKCQHSGNASPEDTPRQPSQKSSLHSPPGTPRTEVVVPEQPVAAEQEQLAAEQEQPAALNPSSSLLSFVRRFSGSRFLRELTNTMSDSPGLGLGGLGVGLALPGLPALGLATPALRLKDSRSLSLQLESEQTQTPKPALQRSERSTLALPRVELDRVVGLAPLRSNVMKVFSKGILSEGAVDFSTTSIQDTARSHSLAVGLDAPTVSSAGAGGAVSAQDMVGLLRSSTKTTTAATSTTESDYPAGGRSSMNLSTHRDLVELLRQDVIPVTTSRGLTANMSEEGIPRPVVDDEHKSLFDLKKSLLTSIPEAASPDEDVPH